MGALVDAYVDSADVFADKSEQEHDHAAYKKQSGEQTCVAHRNFWACELFVNHESACRKADKGAEDADKSCCTQGLDRECGKAVNPKADEACDCVARFAFKSISVMYLNIAEIFGGSKDKAADVGEGVRVADDFIYDELLHDKEACRLKGLGLAYDGFCHFFVGPASEAPEKMLPLMFIVAIDDVESFLKFIHELECVACWRLSVVVETYYIVSRSLTVTCHKRAVLTEIFGKTQTLDIWDVFCQLLNDFPDVIRAAIIYKDDFIIEFSFLGLVLLGDRFLNFVNDSPDGTLAFVARNDKRNLCCAFWLTHEGEYKKERPNWFDFNLHLACMMRLLYPLIASALITVTPFLMTFEKGQDIVRGIFGFSECALLLIFVWVKEGFVLRRGLAKGLKIFGICLLSLIFFGMLLVAFADLSNLLAIKERPMGWYFLVPFVTCGFAVAMVWKIQSFKFSSINLILFVGLVVHLVALNNYASQPLAQLPVIDYLDRIALKPVERKVLPQNFAVRYAVVDSSIIAKNFIDTARSNVIVTVESWGIPMDSARFASELEVFDGLVSVDSAGKKMIGAHSRMYSRTRTAERENLTFAMKYDSASRRRDTLFIPKALRNLGFSTSFFVAEDSVFQWRYKYIRNVGFENVIWNADLKDVDVAAMLDSLLTDSALENRSSGIANSKRIFAAWTTTATKFPIENLHAENGTRTSAYGVPVKKLDSAYTFRLMETLRLVKDLARRHPDVRFIVEGDHEPILSPLEFQTLFYKRWTPYVVLN